MTGRAEREAHSPRAVRRAVFDALDAAVAEGKPVDAAVQDAEFAAIVAFSQPHVERFAAAQVEDAIRLWREGMEVANGS